MHQGFFFFLIQIVHVLTMGSVFPWITCLYQQATYLNSCHAQFGLIHPIRCRMSYQSYWCAHNGQLCNHSNDHIIYMRRWYSLSISPDWFVHLSKQHLHILLSPTSTFSILPLRDNYLLWFQQLQHLSLSPHTPLLSSVNWMSCQRHRIMMINSAADESSKY